MLTLRYLSSTSAGINTALADAWIRHNGFWASRCTASRSIHAHSSTYLSLHLVVLQSTQLYKLCGVNDMYQQLFDMYAVQLGVLTLVQCACHVDVSCVITSHTSDDTRHGHASLVGRGNRVTSVNH
jgi:hypothetical protein